MTVSVPKPVFSSETDVARPNILFIFTDDHAYQAIGAYGSNRNETPNMDRLADGGMRFTNCCVTNSICGPSRAVVQTGKYSHVNGFMTNDDKFDIDQPTFPKILRTAGYQTAIVGKWHLECEVKGFDYSEVLVGQGPYLNPVMIRDGERVKYTGRTTELITELSIRWLRDRNPSKPFLLMMQHKAPHRPWMPYIEHFEKYRNLEIPYPETFDDDYSGRGRASLEQDMTIADTLDQVDLKLNSPGGGMTGQQKADWHKMFDGRKAEYLAVKDDPDALKRWKYQCYMKDYLSCVDSVDRSIGQMLDFLHDNDLSENTVVVYASDQGFYLGEHGWFDKRFMYNESFKTPLIVRWPGQIEPGSISDDLVSNIDFAQTFLEMAKVSIPADMQGRSLVPILRGERPEDWRRSIYYHYYEFPAVHFVKKHEGVYDGRYKLIHFYDDIDEWEFYDLAKDPDELRNIHSEEDHIVEIDRLREELEKRKKELNVPPIRVNTKSLLFEETEIQQKEIVRKRIDSVRKNVIQRRKLLSERH